MGSSARALATPSTLPDSLHERLNAYALAASVAGVAMLAASPSAEAEVVYTHAHVVLSAHHKYLLDLNHDGIADFVIQNKVFSSTDVWGHTLRALPIAHSNQVAGMKGVVNTLYASAFKAGSKIGPARVFSGKLLAASGMEYGYVGRWQDVTNRYLGLKFYIAGQAHFGWARLNVASGTGKITAVLTGYAYETVPGKPIVAGATSPPAAPGSKGADPALSAPTTPQTLGMLAAGAPALSIWRREAE